MDVERNLMLVADQYEFHPTSEDDLSVLVSRTLQEQQELNEDELALISAAGAGFRCFADRLDLDI